MFCEVNYQERVKCSEKDEIATIESEQTEARPVGTVTIDNEKYGRYMGEIQVTLVDLPKDEKVNTITRIIEKIKRYCR